MRTSTTAICRIIKPYKERVNRSALCIASSLETEKIIILLILFIPVNYSEEGSVAKIYRVVGRYSPELAALLVVTIWGTNFVFQKAALVEFDTYVFICLRFSGMVAVSWLVLYLRRRLKVARHKSPESLVIARQDWARVVVSGLLGYTLYIQISTVGLSYTTAFSSALLIATSPLFMTILLWFFRLEQIQPGRWIALLIALLGVIIFVLDKAQIGLRLTSLGDLISLASAFFFAAYNVVNKPLLTRYPAPVLTAYTLTTGAIPVLLISTPALFGQDWSRISVVGWGALLWGIVFPVYLAWTIWSWVNLRLGVSRTAPFMYLVPIIGGLTSWVLLGEGFGIQKIVGACLILGSLALVRYQATRRQMLLKAIPNPTQS